VLGACVEPHEANAYCGRARVFEGGRCVPRACPEAQRADWVTGECLGARALRTIATHQHVVVGEDETLGCHDGSALVIASGRARCVDEGDAGAAWAEFPCVRGAAFDAQLGRCVRVVSSSNEGMLVDVATWTRAVFGADGGPGSARFCERIGVDPFAFGVDVAAETTTRIAIQLDFPNNDITQLHGRIWVAEDGGASRLPPSATTFAETTLRPFVEALRAIGGTASAASVSSVVRCVVRGGGQPFPLAPPSMLN
jgi:hypothetical protein